VEVATPSRGDIFATHSGTAAIEAYADALVVAKVGGEIREILVEEGDDVRAGQVLARLDGDRLRLDLAQSEARLQKLRKDFQRNRDLKERSLISAGDFEKIQYEMEALEASWNLAKLELGYTEIRAPISGVVAERIVKTGNTIEVNSPMFRVTSLEPLVAYLHVPEREYRRVEARMPVTITVDALSDVRFDATVARVGPVVDPATGTFKITIEVNDPTRRLKPGMFARVNIVSDKHEDALQVPRNAVIEEAGETSVYVIAGDLAEKRAVRTGFSSNGRIEVVDGLAEGERFIVVGQTGLRDGSRVSIVNAAQGDQSAAAANE
jgi:membrane fusion protein (multidrug efflux system)